jgi:hypothetical protein
MQDEKPNHKGAGLGFIDMKMKSGTNIHYTIIPYNDRLSFISITVFIPFENAV